MLFSTNTEKTWWHTGFVFGQQDKSQLTMVATLFFDSSQLGMIEPLKNGLTEKGASCVVNGSTLTVKWGE